MKKELIDLVKSNQNIKKVWIDANGDWHTYEVKDCKVITREEVLKAKPIENVVK